MRWLPKPPVAFAAFVAFPALPAFAALAALVASAVSAASVFFFLWFVPPYFSHSPYCPSPWPRAGGMARSVKNPTSPSGYGGLDPILALY